MTSGLKISKKNARNGRPLYAWPAPGTRRLDTRATTGLWRCAPGAVGVYANALQEVPEDFTNRTLGVRPDVTHATYVDAARGWLDTGAEIVGGCCGIGPETIAELRGVLDRRASSAQT